MESKFGNHRRNHFDTVKCVYISWRCPVCIDARKSGFHFCPVLIAIKHLMHHHSGPLWPILYNSLRAEQLFSTAHSDPRSAPTRSQSLAKQLFQFRLYLAANALKLIVTSNRSPRRLCHVKPHIAEWELESESAEQKKPPEAWSLALCNSPESSALLAALRS